METALRIEQHGPSSGTAMSYTQRQPTHRQNHTQQDLYKPSRSPLPPAPSRYPFPGSPQLQPPVVVGQLATPAPPQQAQQTMPPSNTQQPQQQQQQPPPQSQRFNIGSAPAPPQPALPPPTGYRDTYRQHRISLLHPDYGGRREILLQGGGGGGGASGGGPAHHMESSMSAMGQQPFKKIRLQDHKDIQPLRIDTREQPGAYNPQVEAISPTLPDHIQQEDQAFRTTKDELLQQIGKVDREIAKTESQISILRKKMQELEESASKPSTKTEVEEDCQPKHQSLAQKIYAENRKKAQSAHATLDSLGPKVEWPIYNQPSDAPGYHENKRKHLTYKRKLLEYFKKRHVERDNRNSHLIVTYSKMMQEWHRKVDKTESSSKRKTKEAKNREFFERVFPELRKQREDKERFNRVGARIKSEADMEEIMDNLQEQVMEDKKMRSYAVIPPIMLDAKERKNVYQNNNGHILDMEVVHKSRQFLNIWTAAEKEIFKEKYLQHPKNFYLIASCLEKKSVADCVQYYYVSKKTENYKQLLKRSRQRTRHRPPKSNAVVDNLPPGVVTRHQKEQQQQQQKIQQNYDSVDNNVNASSTAVTLGGLTASTTVVSSTNATNNNSSTALTPTSCSITSSSSSPAPASTPSTVISNNNGNGSATNVTTASATAVVVKTEIIESGGEENKCESTNISDKKLLNDIVVKIENTSSNEGSNSDAAVGAASVVKKEDGVKKEDAVPVKKEDIVIKKEDGVIDSYGSDQNFTPNTVVENKKKKERRKDKDNCQIESSEDESVDLIDKSTQGQCIVCGSQLGPQLQSRPLAPNQANLYGLREDQIPPNGRVCNTCRCKSVRSRYTHCPLPTCPNARGRVKRLRSFPQRLQELPQDVRDQLLSEFHVPSGVTKCCSACFNRIQRRLGLVEDWPEEEVNHLRSVLTEVGANWQMVGERLNKTAQQVRSFYATNRKRLDLESCLGDRKPTLTDEEESGSSTSSCEEPLRERHSSDTISAESPPVNHEQTTNPTRKEDYDSSATETADEGQTPDHYQGSATITPVNPDGQTRSNTPPRSVKDIMIKVIEKQLKKSSGPPQPQLLLSSGIAPTISSILNDSNEVTIVSEYNLNNQPPRNQRGEISIAKLTPLIGATITAVQVPPQTSAVVQEPQSRDDLVVMQVQDGREPENLTLDLSIKKNREFPPPAHAKHQLRAEPYLYHERKSPAVYSSRILQPKLPSPKPANPKAGSITMGTPIINQPRYDGLLRQITPDPKMGSITQGTPIHVPGHVQDKRMYDYFGKRPPQAQNVQPPPPPQNANFPGQYRQPYSVEQQLSRQIIMNDYITSQQMEKLGRRSEKSYYLTTSSPHRTPPPQNPQSQQQRQGVIQRHTRPHYPPPGHEALTSLVDVAVQQPSLPVPTAPHEGLGKTIADNILEQPHRFQIIQQQQQQLRQQQQRIEIDRRYHQQQQQQARQQQVTRNETSTLTAANLIDAIITHQINQSENTREVVSNNREPPRASDRLFQSFHREQPQQDNNGERSPSVISVDLDSDTVSKNLTVKELTDSVISHDFNTRQPYYAHQETINEQWKRRLQPREEKRSGTPQNQPQSQDERQIIRIAQPQKYPVEPVSPPDNNHWPEQNYRRYTQPQPHISALDYVKNRIVEVMRTEDDKKETHSTHDRSDSPGDMVIDEEKHEAEFQPQTQPGFTYNYVKDNSTAGETVRNEPEPLLDSKYEPLSDED